MYRSFFSAILVVLFASECVIADDFLLRLETIGFRDRPQHEKEPPQEVLESMEIVARVNQPFHGSATLGAEKISFHGILEQEKDGRFRVQFKYRKSKARRASSAVSQGELNPLIEASEFGSTNNVELDKSIELGGTNKSTRTQDGQVSKTETRSRLSLLNYDPSKN